MIGGAISNTLDAAFARTETFQNGGGSMFAPARSALVAFITLIVMFALILFVGKYLWNNVLVALVPAVKPAKSVWQILGLAVLISLMYPGYCC